MKYASNNPITNLLLAGCLVLTLLVDAAWLPPYKVDAADGNQSGATIDDEIPAGVAPTGP